jgi:hypothetical protein
MLQCSPLNPFDIRMQHSVTYTVPQLQGQLVGGHVGLKAMYLLLMLFPLQQGYHIILYVLYMVVKVSRFNYTEMLSLN